jgi:1,4-alpha-glucan branching enzyme
LEGLQCGTRKSHEAVGLILGPLNLECSSKDDSETFVKKPFLRRSPAFLLTFALTSVALAAPDCENLAARDLATGISGRASLNSDLAYRTLGANVNRDGACQATGVLFRVWLPNAKSVEVLLESENFAEGRLLEKDPATDNWEVFVPGVQAGEKYRYRVLDSTGRWQVRTDPLSRYTWRDDARGSRLWSSVVVDPSTYHWQSSNFRPDRDRLRIMEVHPGTLVPGKPSANFREIADYLVKVFADSRYNAVSLMPISHHNLRESWGYQVGSLYSVDYRHGTPDDFRALVDTLHAHGIAVLIDLVHSHASKDEDTGLGHLDGTQLYFAEGIMGEHPQWGTFLFDYDRRQVREFLWSNALFWLDEYGLDGFRVDGVASMIYLDFARGPKEWIPGPDGTNRNAGALSYMKTLNERVRRFKPGAITVAEESSGFPGVTDRDGLGFDYVWRMGGMHDIRTFLAAPEASRNLRTILNPIGWGARYINYIDSHDETAHGKRYTVAMVSDAGDAAKYAQLRNAEILNAIVYPGCPMDFQGDEYGAKGWWDENTPPDPSVVQPGNAYDRHHNFIQALGDFYLNEPSIVDKRGASSRTWLADNRRQLILQSRVSAGGSEDLLILQNYASAGYAALDLPVPSAGPWQIVFNSDEPNFGGRGVDVPVVVGTEAAGSGFTLHLQSVPARTSLILKR